MLTESISGLGVDYAPENGGEAGAARQPHAALSEEAAPPLEPDLAHELYGHMAEPLTGRTIDEIDAGVAHRKELVHETVRKKTSEAVDEKENAKPAPTKESLQAELEGTQAAEEADLEVSKAKALKDLDDKIAAQRKLLDDAVLGKEVTAGAEKTLADQAAGDGAALDKQSKANVDADNVHMAETMKAQAKQADDEAAKIVADAETQAKGIEAKGEADGMAAMMKFQSEAMAAFGRAAQQAQALRDDGKPESQAQKIESDAAAAQIKMIQDGTAAHDRIVQQAKTDAHQVRTDAKAKADAHKGKSTAMGTMGVINADVKGIVAEAKQLEKGKASIDAAAQSGSSTVRADADEGRKQQRAKEQQALDKLEKERADLVTRLDAQIAQQKKTIEQRAEYMEKAVKSANPAALTQLAASVKWADSQTQKAHETIDASAKAQVAMADQRMKTQAKQTVSAMEAQGKVALAKIDADAAAAKQQVAATSRSAQAAEQTAHEQTMTGIDDAAGKAAADSLKDARQAVAEVRNEAANASQSLDAGSAKLAAGAKDQADAIDARTKQIADKDWAAMEKQAKATEAELERKCGKLVTDQDGIRDLYRQCADDPDKLEMLKKVAAEKHIDLDKMVEKSQGSMLHSKAHDNADMKELRAYEKGDMDTANVAVFEQGDQKRCAMVVDDVQKEDGGLEKLGANIEEQTGATPTHMLMDNLAPDKYREVGGKMAGIEAKQKEERDEGLAKRAEAETAQETAKLTPEQREARLDKKKREMADVASKLNAELNSVRVGNDYKATDLLRGKSAEEVLLLKQAYKDGGYGDLDQAIDSRLDGKDRKAAKAELSGDPVLAAEAQIEQANDGWGSHTETWRAAMETLKTPEDRARLAAVIQKHTGFSYDEINKDKNTGFTRDEMQAEAVVDDEDRKVRLKEVAAEKAQYGEGKMNAMGEWLGDRVFDGETDEHRQKRRAAAWAHQDEQRKAGLASAILTGNPMAIAMSPSGPNTQAYLDAQEGMTPDERARFESDLKRDTGKSAAQINRESLDGFDKKAADALADGNELKAKAMRQLSAGDHFFHNDREGMSKRFEDKDLTPEQREQMAQYMDEELKKDGKGGVDQFYKDHLNGEQYKAATERMKDGYVDDVTALLEAGSTTMGLGKNTPKMTEILAKYPPGEELEKFKKRFAKEKGVSLEDYLKKEASSRGEEKDFAMLAEGNYAMMSSKDLAAMAEDDPQKLIQRMKDLHSAAKGDATLGNAVGNELADVTSNTGKVVDAREGRAMALEKKLKDGGGLSNEERDQLVTDMRFMSGDKDGFVENKNEVIDKVGDGVSVATEVGVDCLTGSDQAGALAGGLAKMATKAELNGERYSTDDMLQDGLQTVGSVAMMRGAGKLKVLAENPLLRDVVEGGGQALLGSAVNVNNLRDPGAIWDTGPEAFLKGALSRVAGSSMGHALGGTFGRELENGEIAFASKGAALANGLTGAAGSAVVDVAVNGDYSNGWAMAKQGLGTFVRDGVKLGGRRVSDHVARGTEGSTSHHEEASASSEEEEAQPTMPAAPAPAPAHDEAQVDRVTRAFEEQGLSPEAARARARAEIVVDEEAPVSTKKPAAAEEAHDEDPKAPAVPEAHDEHPSPEAVAAAERREDLAAKARKQFDMNKALGREKNPFYEPGSDEPEFEYSASSSDLNAVERSMRDFADGNEEAQNGECSVTCERFKEQFAKQGVNVPIWDYQGHRWMSADGLIIDPTFGQFFKGKMTTLPNGKSQYEPFVGTYDEMKVRVQEAIDHGLMPDVAPGTDAAKVMEENWGARAPGKDGQLGLVDGVQPFKAGKQPATASKPPAAEAAEEEAIPDTERATKDGEPIGYTPWNEPVYHPADPAYTKPQGRWKDTSGDWHDSEGEVLETRSEGQVRVVRSNLVSTADGQQALQHLNGDGSAARIVMRDNSSYRQGDEINLDPRMTSDQQAETMVHEVNHHRTYDREVQRDSKAGFVDSSIQNEAESVAAQAEHSAEKGQVAHPVAEDYKRLKAEAMRSLGEENPDLSPSELEAAARQQATAGIADQMRRETPSTSVDEDGYLIPGKPATYEEYYRQQYDQAQGIDGPITERQAMPVRRVGKSDAVDLKKYVPSEIDGEEVEIGKQRSIVMDNDWRRSLRDSGLADGDAQHIYAARDEDGAVLKIGKTEAETIEGRFAAYANAQNYGGKRVTIDVLEANPPEGMKVEQIEGATREAVASDASDEPDASGQVLRWDNTKGRLGRQGPGTPGVSTHEMRENGQYWNRATGEFMDPGAVDMPGAKESVAILRGLLQRTGGDVNAIKEITGVPRTKIMEYLDVMGLDPENYTY